MLEKNKVLIWLSIIFVWSLLISISLQTALLTLFLMYFLLSVKEHKSTLKHPVSVAFLLFYAAAIITSLFSQKALYGIKNAIALSFDTLVPFIFGLLATEYGEKQVKKQAIHAFTIISILTLIAFFISHLGFSPILNRRGLLTGFLGGKLTYPGVISSFGSVVFERLVALPGTLSIIAAISLVTTIAINGSRSYILGILVSAIVVLFLNIKRFIKIILPFLIILLALIFLFPKTRHRIETARMHNPDGSVTIRLSLWQTGLKVLKEHPLFGIGFETWPLLADTIIRQKGDSLLNEILTQNTVNTRAIRGHLHNTYLQMLLNGGLILFIFYLYLILIMLKEAFKLDNTMKYAFLFMFFTFLVAGFFEYNFSDAEVAHSIFFFSGLYLSRGNKK